jgi:hypothetical protein
MALPIYASSLDFRYFGNNFISLERIRKTGNAGYESLNFDEAGSVLLDCADFQIDQKRWNGFTNFKDAAAGVFDHSLSEMKNVIKIAKDVNSELMLVETPLRRAAGAIVLKPEIEGLWKTIAYSVNDTGGVFLNAAQFHHYGDDEFSDYAHLNRCGAMKEAESIVPAVRRLLERNKHLARQ